MKRLLKALVPAFAVAAFASTAQAQYTVYGLTASGNGQQLIRFNSSTPGAVTVIGPTNANLTGLDFRPFNGLLYGYDGNLLYTVNVLTGVTTVAFDITNAANAFVGFDFNPMADRLRIVDGSGQNLRVNPIDGTTIVDGVLTYIAGDANFSNSPFLTGVAYTNNDNDPATGTTLYGIDARNGNLVVFQTPNAGTLQTVGNLGFTFAPQLNGFDIVTNNGNNFAFLAATPANLSNLYSVNLNTGLATNLGSIGVANVSGLAVVPITAVPEPGSVLLVAVGLAGAGVVARRRRTV